MAITGAIFAGAGITLAATGQIKQGRAAKKIGEINARQSEEVGELNAQLIEEGAESNSEIAEFNARMAEARARDAIYRGREEEGRFRTDIRGLIGSQRAAYAGQNVDVGDGSALDVQTDTAYQGELTALKIRLDFAREAWGYRVDATNERLAAEATRKMGRLQARAVRTSARYSAESSRAGGSAAQTAGYLGAAGSILTGGYQVYQSTRTRST